MSHRQGHDLTPLHMAAADGDLEAVRAAIASGQRRLSRFDEVGLTPLHHAAQNGHVAVVQALIEAGADVNAHDPSVIGNTPLGQIAENCSLEMAQILVNAGADPTIRGWMQLSAIDRAKDRQRDDGPQVYQLLLSAARRLPTDRSS